MQDLKKIMNQDGLFVLATKDGDLVPVDGMETACMVSLYTDARLDESEVSNPITRSGWVGNVFTGRQLGGKLWYLENAVITTGYLGKVKEALTRSFDWMLTDRVARNIATKATSPKPQTVAHEVKITARDGVSLDYKYLWDRTKPFYERVT